MIDQRNLIIAVILSILIVSGYEYFYVRPQVEAIQQEAAKQEAAKPLIADKPGTEKTIFKDRAEGLAASPRIQIETPRVTGSINLQGGRLDDLTLVDYRQTVEDDSPPIQLLNPARYNLAYYIDYGWLIDGVKVPTAKTQWAADKQRLTSNQPVTLTWNNGEGITFKRKYSIDENYLITVDQSVTNNTKKQLEIFDYGLINRRGPILELAEKSTVLHIGPLSVVDGKLEEHHYDDLEEEGAEQQTSKGGWLGITDKYWLVAMIPGRDETRTFTFKHLKRVDSHAYQVDYLSPATLVEPGETYINSTHTFAGAKEIDLLDAYSSELNVEHLDLAIDFGWFYFLTKPIFQLLEFIYGLVGNFGVSILIMTLIIRALVFPLAQTSFRSMNRMRELGPQMTKLRELYGEDKMRLNQEMMALYRKEKINPMAGCLPIVIQIPVFFALYKVFLVTIEMRHTPFFGWIEDLSVADPTNIFTLFGYMPWDPPSILHVGIWPILMGFTMWAQQKLNPKPTDPTQAKVFAVLPFVFTFILAKFPSGLVIYWTWSNLLSVLQQRLLAKTGK